MDRSKLILSEDGWQQLNAVLPKKNEVYDQGAIRNKLTQHLPLKQGESTKIPSKATLVNIFTHRVAVSRETWMKLFAAYDIESLVSELVIDAIEENNRNSDNLSLSWKRNKEKSSEAKSIQNHNLPPLEGELIGEIPNVRVDRLTEQLINGGRRLLFLYGFGGQGKTTTALHIAHKCAAHLRDGAWWVELRNIMSRTYGGSKDEAPELVRREITRTLSHNPENSLTFLEGQDVLIVLDCMDHIEEPEELVAGLLKDFANSPGIRFIVTARRKPNIDRIGNVAEEITQLNSEDAVLVFEHYAKKNEPIFAVSAENHADVLALCESVLFSPLFIRIISRYVSQLHPRQMLKQFQSLKVKLQLGEVNPQTVHNLPEGLRHETVRAILMWVTEALKPDEIFLFRHVALFRGSFSWKAAFHITKPSQDNHGPTQGNLNELRRWGVIDERKYPSLEEMRFTMPDIIAETVGDALPGYLPVDALQHFYDFFYQLAEPADTSIFDDKQIERLHVLEADFANLNVALDWCLQNHNRFKKGLLLAGVLRYFWFNRSHFEEGYSYITRLIEEEKDNADPILLAKAYACAADMVYADEQDNEESRMLFNKSIEYFSMGGDKIGEAKALIDLAWIDWEAEEYETANSGCLQAITLLGKNAETSNDKHILEVFGFAVQTQGQIAFSQECYHEAIDYYEKACAIYRSIDEFWGLSIALSGIGETVLSQDESRYEEALHYYKQYLEIALKLEQHYSIAYSFEGIAYCKIAQGQMKQAVNLLGAAEHLRKVIHYYLGEPEMENYNSYLLRTKEALHEKFDAVWQEGYDSIDTPQKAVLKAQALLSEL